MFVQEEELKRLKLRCEQLAVEKCKALDELKQTQVMSRDQLEKLCNLELKQDLLEVENMQARKNLMKSECKNDELAKNFSVLQNEKQKLVSENDKLLQIIT